MQHVSLVHEFFEKVLCGQQLELLAEMTTDNVVSVAPQAVDVGRVAVRRTFESNAKAVQFLEVDVLFAAEVDNRAAARICLRGLQSGTNAGIRSSSRGVSLPCVYLFDFVGPRISMIEVYYDVQLLTSQIGNGQVRFLR